MLWKFIGSAFKMGRHINNSPENKVLTSALENNPGFVSAVKKIN